MVSRSTDDLQTVGAYQILGRLGRGGMGVVFRGRHRNHMVAARQGGDVAIKVMHDEYARDAHYKEQFDKEAALCMELYHSNIVRPFDLVLEHDTLALVMTLVEGETLRERLERTGPIPSTVALPLFRQLLDAIGYAHSEGVIHRDLKPSNIVISTAGQIQVLDFGIAKDMTEGTERTGRVMGTIDYMAPEQYQDAGIVEARADVYALGITLYEMLAGRLPWTLETPVHVIAAIKAQESFPPPTTFYPFISDVLVDVLYRATRADPAQRISSISAFHAALAGL